MARIEVEINNYIYDINNNRIKKPGICERCKRSRSLIWWSKYKRNLITFGKIFTDIPIRRVRCCDCGKTSCVLPKFILKFCRYGKDIIVFAIKELKKHTYEKVAEKILLRLSEGIDIAVHTLIFWKRKYRLANL